MLYATERPLPRHRRAELDGFCTPPAPPDGLIDPGGAVFELLQGRDSTAYLLEVGEEKGQLPARRLPVTEPAGLGD
jgi:hypothetical protein